MTIAKEEQREILKRLKEPFAPEDHQERVLPGSGKWFFISWQKIRERLDDVCPDWEVDYSEPVYIDAYCTIRCTLTIAGIKRSAPGNGEIKNKRGTPIENATADAFKNAAEAFGVARYLDEQSKEAREFTIRYLHSKGDGRAKKNAIENGYLENSTARSLLSKPAARPPAPSDAPEPEQTAETPKVSANGNQARIKEVCSLLGLKKPHEVYNLAAAPIGIKKGSADLTPSDLTKIVDEILAQWGLSQGCFRAATHARNAFIALMQKPDIGSDLPSIVAAWQKEVDRRVAAIAESKALKASEPPDGWKEAVAVS